MRNVVRQRRREMRQEDEQTARHIIVFVFSHLPLSLESPSSRTSPKAKPCLKLVTVVRASRQALPPMCTSRAAFLKVTLLRDSFAHEILGRYRHSFGLAVSVNINVLRARAVDVDRLRQHTSHRHGGVKPLERNPSLCGGR